MLASKEDVSNIFNLYEEFFGADADAYTEAPPSLAIPFGHAASSEADPGVEVEAFMSAEVVALCLGFFDRLPLVFSRIRHGAGLTGWDTKYTHLFEKPSPLATNNMMEPTVLHCTNLVGSMLLFERYSCRNYSPITEMVS